MPTAAVVAALALQALLDELDGLQPHQIDRIAASHSTPDAATDAARSRAMSAIVQADRLDLLDSVAQRLATVCLEGEVSRPARAAAYDALIAIMASDLVEQPVFRALYAVWDDGTDGGGSRAILGGEELLLRIV